MLKSDVSKYFTKVLEFRAGFSFTRFTQDLCWSLTTLEIFDFKIPIVFIG